MMMSRKRRKIASIYNSQLKDTNLILPIEKKITFILIMFMLLGIQTEIR